MFNLVRYRAGCQVAPRNADMPQMGSLSSSRRRALGTLLALAAAPFAYAAAEEVGERAARIAERFGVAVRYGLYALPQGDLPTAASDLPQIAQLLAWAEEALLLYPAGFVARNGLKEIRFARTQRSCANAGAYANPSDGHVVFAVRGVDWSREEFVATVHHELFHVFDYAYFKWSGWERYRDDPDWARLNAAGFSYGEGGHKCREPHMGRLDFPYRGFPSWYSMCAIAEDKAVLFEALIDNRSRALVLERAAADPLLRAKLDLLLARVRAAGFDPKIVLPRRR